MTLSDRSASFRKNVPSPNADRGQAYARFIPREELAGFAAWQPGVLGGGPAPQQNVHAPRPAAADAPPPPQVDPGELIGTQIQAARQGGYQDGYRDGLAALENFKQAFAGQATAQVGALLAAFDARLDALEQELAHTLARAATQLARQVVRDELRTDPARVAKVADEAVEALLHAARHVTLRVHPDDHPLVAEGAGEALEARGARLIDDPSMTRGGVRIDSDIGVVDATIETRWRQAAASVGCDAPWDEATAPSGAAARATPAGAAS